MNKVVPSFSDPRLSDQIAHIEEFPARPATYGDPRRAMHPRLVERLDQLGMPRLYTHQAQAYDEVMAGRDVVVTTGTNSGKTLCYNLPALQIALSEPASRCLYLFPTKALAQDQLGKLEALIPSDLVRLATYDGDTPKSQRSSIRKLSHIVLTNPDMLHVGILPGHENWVKFLKSLRLIVIDEMHVYRGAFGSNVAGVLRRLLRLCEWHHSRPQIVGCSATIGNPQELFTRLTGRKPVLIEENGAPSGKRTFVLYNPPSIGETDRLSPNVATSEIFATLVESGQRTLAFSRARVVAELVLRYTRKRLKDVGHTPENAIESYRAGYTIKERRQLEQALFRGKLLGMSATNAMELGIDVGALDAVVMNGYPGTSSSFWQQAGRAGRGEKDGLAVFVAHNDPLEQFLIRQPKMLLDARNESVSINPENRTILARQLRCAAHERPIAPSELERFGESALGVAEEMDRAGELQFQSGSFYYPAIEPPAFSVNIRGADGEQVRLYVDGVELGTMDRWQAMTGAHAGAVYLHRGQSFVVTSLDLEANRADVIPMEVDYFTRAIVRSVIDPKIAIRESGLAVGNIGLCGVTVTDLVDGYRQIALDGERVLSTEVLDLPPQTYDTIAVRFDLPELDLEGDLARQFGTVHGLEHALRAVAPLLCGCDREDLGSAWYTVFPDTMRPAVFLFDKTPGGIGLTQKLYDSVGGWLKASLQLLQSCECPDGCPACIMSTRCEAQNESLDKAATIELLRRLA